MTDYTIKAENVKALAGWIVDNRDVSEFPSCYCYGDPQSWNYCVEFNKALAELLVMLVKRYETIDKGAIDVRAAITVVANAFVSEHPFYFIRGYKDAVRGLRIAFDLGGVDDEP